MTVWYLIPNHLAILVKMQSEIPKTSTGYNYLLLKPVRSGSKISSWIVIDYRIEILVHFL